MYFNKLILESIYHMTLEYFEIMFSYIKMQRFCHLYVILLWTLHSVTRYGPRYEKTSLRGL